MYHIKRDGNFLCIRGDKRRKRWTKGDNFASFSHAHNISQKHLKRSACSDCVKRYYDIVSKMNPPIIR